MADPDLTHEVKVVKAFYAKDETGTSDGPDLDITPSEQQFKSLEFFVQKENGDSGDTNTFKVEHKSSGGTYSALTDADGNEFTLSLDSASSESGTISVPPTTTVKDKVRLALTSHTPNATNADFFATCNKYGAKFKPV